MFSKSITSLELKLTSVSSNSNNNIRAKARVIRNNIDLYNKCPTKSYFIRTPNGVPAATLRERTSGLQVKPISRVVAGRLDTVPRLSKDAVTMKLVWMKLLL